MSEHTLILLRNQGPGAIMSWRSIEGISDHCAWSDLPNWGAIFHGVEYILDE